MPNADRNARRADREYLRELEARIVSWDPVGLIASGAPLDEYDCLVSPVAGGLRRGLSPEELAATLDRFILGHFGLQAQGTAAFAVEVIGWDHSQRGV
jgi:hypothetical protein